jgi:hypothetical protein
MIKKNFKIVTLLIVFILLFHVGMSFYRQVSPSISKISGEIPDLNLSNNDYLCIKGVDSISKNKIVLIKRYGDGWAGSGVIAGKVIALSGNELEVGKDSTDHLKYKFPKSESEMNTKIIVPLDSTAIAFYTYIYIAPNSEIRHEMKYKINGSLELYKCFIGL